MVSKLDVDLCRAMNTTLIELVSLQRPSSVHRAVTSDGGKDRRYIHGGSRRTICMWQPRLFTTMIVFVLGQTDQDGTTGIRRRCGVPAHQSPFEHSSRLLPVDAQSGYKALYWIFRDCKDDRWDEIAVKERIDDDKPFELRS